jgi:hypothetical protein
MFFNKSNSRSKRKRRAAKRLPTIQEQREIPLLSDTEALAASSPSDNYPFTEQPDEAAAEPRRHGPPVELVLKSSLEDPNNNKNKDEKKRKS